MCVSAPLSRWTVHRVAVHRVAYHLHDLDFALAFRTLLSPARTQATAFQRLLHGAHRTPACHDPDAGALRRLTKRLHDVVAQEIGQQDQQIGTARQLQGFLLMRRISSADVVRDTDIELLEQVGNVAQTVCTDNDGANCCCMSHDLVHHDEVNQ